MNRIIEKHQAAGERPRLLLHACCAPCATSVLERLAKAFRVTVLFYNPNISPVAEYEKRAAELCRLLREMPECGDTEILVEPYDGTAFFEAARGLEKEPEGGARCTACFRLRLRYTAQLAKARGFDYFTTTLTVSPLKDAARLNAVGEVLQDEIGVLHLPSDFKKRDGYKRSTALSGAYGLYRQDYCGCIFSKAERTEKKHGSDV